MGAQARRGEVSQALAPHRGVLVALARWRARPLVVDDAHRPPGHPRTSRRAARRRAARRTPRDRRAGARRQSTGRARRARSRGVRARALRDPRRARAQREREEQRVGRGLGGEAGRERTEVAAPSSWSPGTALTTDSRGADSTVSFSQCLRLGASRSPVVARLLGRRSAVARAPAPRGVRALDRIDARAASCDHLAHPRALSRDAVKYWRTRVRMLRMVPT